MDEIAVLLMAYQSLWSKSAPFRKNQEIDIGRANELAPVVFKACRSTAKELQKSIFKHPKNRPPKIAEARAKCLTRLQEALSAARQLEEDSVNHEKSNVITVRVVRPLDDIISRWSANGHKAG